MSKFVILKLISENIDINYNVKMLMFKNGKEYVLKQAATSGLI